MDVWVRCFFLYLSYCTNNKDVCMLEEKECSVMQVQCLDSKQYWAKRSVFIVMDSTLDWVHVYLNKVCGKQPHINCSCRKVKYD